MNWYPAAKNQPLVLAKTLERGNEQLSFHCVPADSEGKTWQAIDHSGLLHECTSLSIAFQHPKRMTSNQQHAHFFR
jgi:hypothetical protein